MIMDILTGGWIATLVYVVFLVVVAFWVFFVEWCSDNEVEDVKAEIKVDDVKVDDVKVDEGKVKCSFCGRVGGVGVCVGCGASVS